RLRCGGRHDGEREDESADHKQEMCPPRAQRKRWRTRLSRRDLRARTPAKEDASARHRPIRGTRRPIWGAQGNAKPMSRATPLRRPLDSELFQAVLERAVREAEEASGLRDHPARALHRLHDELALE